MHKKAALQQQEGFTILELTIATVIFSTVLLVATAGIVRFTTTYIKSNTSSETQNTARSIIQEVSESLQFSKTFDEMAESPTHWEGYCIDGKRYSYKIGTQVDAVANPVNHRAYHALVEDIPGSCQGSDNPLNGDALASKLVSGVLVGGKTIGQNPQELLSNHMRLSAFDITQTDTGWEIHVRVAYGDDDLLGVPSSGNPASGWDKIACRGGNGDQFCSVSDLTTFVAKRL